MKNVIKNLREMQNEWTEKFSKQFVREISGEKINEADLLDRLNLDLAIFRAQRPNCPDAMLRDFDGFTAAMQRAFEGGQAILYKGKNLKDEFRGYLKFWEDLECV